MSDVSRALPAGSGIAVLEAMKGLRRFSGDADSFWELYLQHIRVLCKSPLAVQLAHVDSLWVVFHRNCDDPALLDSCMADASPALFERAHGSGFAFERIDRPVAGLSGPHLVAVRLDTVSGTDRSILLVVLDKSNAQQFNDLLIRLQLVSDIPAGCLSPQVELIPEPSEGSTDRLLAHVIDVAAIIAAKDNFLLACATLVNELALRFNCSQVSIGWEKSGYIRLVAVSNREHFDRQNNVVRDLEAVCEEACSQDILMSWPPLSEIYCVNRAHSAYCREYGVNHLVTVPLRIKGTAVAVVALENKSSDIDRGVVEAAKVVAEQVAPWLDMLHHRDRWLGARAVVGLGRSLDALFSVERSLLKTTVALCLAGLLFLFFGEMEYTIEGSSVLTTDSVGYISAPFDGIISNVRVREGDLVKKNDVLLTFDTRDLVLKAAQSSADVARYMRETEKSRAHEALADMRIAQTRIDESQAELSRVRQYLDLAEIRAPFDGVLVEGDSSKLLGSPVGKGDMLLKVARIDAMYLKVKIHERDIGEFRGREKGRLTLLSRPGDTFTITVDQIIPMAEVDQRDGNVFVVKARIEDVPQSWWRPGMSGVAKFDAGQRRIIWIVSHRLIDFIRMQLWW